MALSWSLVCLACSLESLSHHVHHWFSIKLLVMVILNTTRHNYRPKAWLLHMRQTAQKPIQSKCECKTIGFPLIEQWVCVWKCHNNSLTIQWTSHDNRSSLWTAFSIDAAFEPFNHHIISTHWINIWKMENIYIDCRS